MKRSLDVKWVATDIDGTFTDPNKQITPATREVLAQLRRRGVRTTCISGRCPPGMKQLLLDGGFSSVEYGSLNGAVIVNADGSIASECLLSDRLARQAISSFQERGLDLYMFSSRHWYILDARPAHVEEEAELLGVQPQLVPDFAPYLHECVKVVGVSADTDLVAKTETAMADFFGPRASVARASMRFCDVTNRRGKKGRFVRFLRRRHGLSRQNIVTLGDMPSDADMFRWSIGVAMGNAPDSVKDRASYVTATNAEDGWAQAIEHLVLRRL